MGRLVTRYYCQAARWQRQTPKRYGRTERASITKNASQFEVTIGTNEVYGPTHQFGAAKGEYAPGVPWGDIPARPFLPTEDGGLPQSWEQDILTIIRQHLAS